MEVMFRVRGLLDFILICPVKNAFVSTKLFSLSLEGRLLIRSSGDKLRGVVFMGGFR